MIGTTFKHGIATVLCAAALVTNASAQRDEEILVALDMGYNTAYRDRSWVPVDVTVTNELESIEGWVEVRTFSAGRLQSPIYRAPVTSAKNSRKRFRLHVYLDGADRIEAWLYNGNRPAVEVPQYINLTPIDEGDLLGILLEEDIGRFGFLYSVVRTEEKNLRFHRHGLSNMNLPLLPDYAECYEAFNLMVIGDIGPTRVARRHRQLIGDYVREGGTLVICTGMYGGRYRDTWIEDLSGVTFGEAVDMTEAALAGRVFPFPLLREGASERNDLVFTELEPVADGVRSFGGELPLATMRPLGRGRVYTLAVDATSEAMQGCVGFREIWREMAMSGSSRRPLNVGAAAAVTAQLLPSLSGITIQPRSTVSLYLLLYVGVGILGNWLFWSRMKRREMAWVCLIVFSLGFTGYAMAFGSAGWAKSAELQQIHIIQAPVAGSQADYESFAGILSPRTRTYAGTLARKNFLARDAGSMSARSRGRMLPPGNRFARGSGESGLPFYSIQGEDPGIARFRVGASELRMANIRGRIPMAGGVEGEVTYAHSRLEAQFTNHTGLTLERPTLFIDGTFYPLTATAEGWSLDLEIGPGQRHSTATIARVSSVQNGLQYGGFYGYQKLTLDIVKDYVQTALFMEEGYSKQGIMRSAPPYVLGWVADGVVDGLEPSDNVDEGMSITLVVAEVDSSSEKSRGGLDAIARDSWRPLGVRVDSMGSAWKRTRAPGMDAIWRILDPSSTSRSRTPYGAQRFANSRRGSRVSVQAPASNRRNLRLDLYLLATKPLIDSGEYRLELSARVGREEPVPLQESSTSTETDRKQWLIHTVYEIEEWESLLNPIEPDTLSLQVAMSTMERGGRQPGVNFQYLLVASEEYSSKRADEAGIDGEWLIWR